MRKVLVWETPGEAWAQVTSQMTMHNHTLYLEYTNWAQDCNVCLRRGVCGQVTVRDDGGDETRQVYLEDRPHRRPRAPEKPRRVALVGQGVA